MAVHVRLFHAGQRLNKDFFRDDSGTNKRRRGTKEDDDPLLDGKGLLQLFAKGVLSQEELDVIVPLMRKQGFIGVSVAIENAGDCLDLDSLRHSIARRTVQPSGVIREVPADGDGIVRIPASHQDMGIAFEVRFNSLEELREGARLFYGAIADNKAHQQTWYSRIHGCCHRYIECGDFWRKYDVFKYDFDQTPRLHLVFHPNTVSYSLLASWPCRLKGDSVYQRFALQYPFQSPVVETIPPGAQPPRCHCIAEAAHISAAAAQTISAPAPAASAPSVSASASATPAPTARRADSASRQSHVVQLPKAVYADCVVECDPFFLIPLPEVYHIATPTSAPGLAPSCADLLRLSAEYFLLPPNFEVPLLDRNAIWSDADTQSL